MRYILVFLCALIPTTVYGAEFLALTMLNGLIGTPEQLFNRLIMISIYIGALMSVIMIVWGGIEYMFSESGGSKQKAKERIRDAVIGLLMLLGVYIVFATINDQIVNLDLQIPEVSVNGATIERPDNPEVRSDRASLVELAEVETGFVVTECGSGTRHSCSEVSAQCAANGYTFISANGPNSITCKTPSYCANSALTDDRCRPLDAAGFTTETAVYSNTCNDDQSCLVDEINRMASDYPAVSQIPDPDDPGKFIITGYQGVEQCQVFDTTPSACRSIRGQRTLWMGYITNPQYTITTTTLQNK